MKKRNVIILPLLFLLSILLGCSSRSFYLNKENLKHIKTTERELQKMVPKDAHHFIERMKFVPGGKGDIGVYPDFKLTPVDSNLIKGMWVRREAVNDFFISDREITVREYNEFITWVVDSLALSLMALHDQSFYLDKEAKRLDWTKSSLLNYWLDSAAKEILVPALLSNYPCDSCWKYKGSQSFHLVSTDKIVYTYVEKGDTIEIPILTEKGGFSRLNNLSFMENWDYNYPTRENYLEYPIVGVNWHQAKAYCHWRTHQLNNKIRSNSSYINFIFRLPTEAEWEYAARAVPVFSRHVGYTHRDFPWPGNSLINDDSRQFKQKFNANFGSNWKDENGIFLKSFIYYRSPIVLNPAKTFPPNELGLYDMAGNVAEWTLDTPYFYHESYLPFVKQQYSRLIMDGDLDSLLTATKVYYTDDMETAIDKIKQRQHHLISLAISRGDTIYQSANLSWSEVNKLEKENLYHSWLDTTNSSFIERYAEWELYGAKNEHHYNQVMERNSPARIVKGGSWADNPVYLLIGVREVFPENHASARIGFRVVMTVKNEEQ